MNTPSSAPGHALRRRGLIAVATLVVAASGCTGADPTPDALLAGLHADVAADRLATALELEDGSESSVAALRVAVTDADWVVRAQALAILSRGGEAAVEIVGPLTSDDHEAVRIGAVAALHAIAGSDVVPWLMAALDDVEHRVRIRSLRALADADGLAVADVARVVELLGDRDAKVRRWASIVVVFVGGTAVTPLIGVLEGDSAYRWRAAWALGQIGRRAAPALPILNALLDDPDKLTRTEAIAAIAAIEANP
jgi:HEAT repeat protein